MFSGSQGYYENVIESFTGDNGFYADRKFKMVDSEGQNCFENL
jgi:hypothetical protein